MWCKLTITTHRYNSSLGGTSTCNHNATLILLVLNMVLVGIYRHTRRAKFLCLCGLDSPNLVIITLDNLTVFSMKAMIISFIYSSSFFFFLWKHLRHIVIVTQFPPTENLWLGVHTCLGMASSAQKRKKIPTNNKGS